MKAKDTVIQNWSAVNDGDYYELAHKQAEITWKAREPEIEESRKAGQKEMFTKLRQVIRGEPVSFDYALDIFEIQWLYEQSKGLFKGS